MARDRRMITKAKPPERLLRFDEADWGELQPDSAHPGQTVRVRSRIAWSKARRDWIRAHVDTEDGMRRLYFGADLTFPPGVDPQVDYDVDAMLVGHRDWVRLPYP